MRLNTAVTSAQLDVSIPDAGTLHVALFGDARDLVTVDLDTQPPAWNRHDTTTRTYTPSTPQPWDLGVAQNQS